MNKSDWQRVSKRRPCPICERPDWCLFAGPDDTPEAVICARIESGRRIGEAGWLHRLRDSMTAWPRWERTIRTAVRMATEARGGPNVAPIAEHWRLAEDSPQLARLAGRLGLSPLSLCRLHVGWSADRGAWAFPMTDPAGKVLGIRLRLRDGKKLSVRGGHEGLFLPDGLAEGGRLLVTEGPTDCAALLDLGFGAVGRPSCTGGVKLLVGLVQQRRPAEVIVVADGDAPGQRGAGNLASVLVAYVASVRIITPPAGIKDGRQWVQHGATAADVQAAIDAAPVRRLAVQVRKAGGRHE